MTDKGAEIILLCESIKALVQAIVFMSQRISDFNTNPDYEEVIDQLDRALRLVQEAS